MAKTTFEKMAKTTLKKRQKPHLKKWQKHHVKKWQKPFKRQQKQYKKCKTTTKIQNKHKQITKTI